MEWITGGFAVAFLLAAIATGWRRLVLRLSGVAVPGMVVGRSVSEFQGERSVATVVEYRTLSGQAHRFIHYRWLPSPLPEGTNVHVRYSPSHDHIASVDHWWAYVSAPLLFLVLAVVSAGMAWQASIPPAGHAECAAPTCRTGQRS